MENLLNKLAVLLRKIIDFWSSPPPVIPPIVPPSPPIPPEIPPDVPVYRWDTPQNARHSIRIIGDEMGLTWAEKDLICAVIEAESGFKNTAKFLNKRNGIVISTDWGICQVNDYYHVGPGQKWSSVKQILDNPDRVVKWMIQMYKQGKLSMWVAYQNKSYLQFMPKIAGSSNILST